LPANKKHHRYFIKSNFEQDAHAHSFSELTEDAPIVTLWHCILLQLFGWPLYMLDNLSGQKGASGFPQHSHYWFDTDSALYKESELFSVFLSDLGVITTCVALFLAVQVFSLWTVLVFYGIPYLWLNQWVGTFAPVLCLFLFYFHSNLPNARGSNVKLNIIVVITYLQHTDPTLPHFTHSTWTFACGASATIDRSFSLGPLDIDKHLFHGIVGTHVLHHLCSSIPFYHAYEATDAVRTVMGAHYREDRDTPLMKALFRNVRDCQFVEEGSGVLFFRNLHGRGVKPRDVASGKGTSVWKGHVPASWDADVKKKEDAVRHRWEWRDLMKFFW
jgi:omega-6 fatty acid desaturase (delta-12 desaturase)